MSNVDILGYVASCLLLLAMLMTSVVKLRIINTAGCILYIMYGLYINSYPVAIMNGAIAIVNIVHLIKGRFVTKSFKVLNANYDDTILKSFIEYNHDDIVKMFPEFSNEDKKYTCSLVILRNMDIAGIFLGTDKGDNTLFSELDYVIPKYRDCEIGKYLFNKRRDIFKQFGFNYITALSGTKHHSKYLKKIGFKEIYSESGIKKFCLKLYD